MLALLVGAVTWLYETTAWTALFCCTAGCAMQNFASGLTELCWALAGVPETADASLGAHLTRFGINVTCILAVYVPFYLAFVRKISREALERIDNPALLAVMAAVMLGVIGFDLLIKCMGDFGQLTIWFMVPLRLFHGLMCVLTFALEYELPVNRHLQIERETEARVHAERERQYELSRANIEAINIKCHDIKHQIRALAGGGANHGFGLRSMRLTVESYSGTLTTLVDYQRRTFHVNVMIPLP